MDEPQAINLLRSLRPDTLIPKPRSKNEFRIVGWARRRGVRALIYFIPNKNTPEKPFKKGVTESEWAQAYERLEVSGEFSSQWFQENLTACAKEGLCNFTTIGGIFELLGLGVYEKPGMYRKSSRQ